MAALSPEQKKQLDAARNKALDLMAKRKSLDALLHWIERDLKELDTQARELYELLTVIENARSPLEV